MLIETRLGEILSIVEQKKSVSVQELMQLINVSEATVRRDLNTLDANGKLIKIHGGAMAIGSICHTTDDDVLYRKNQNMEAKIRIAKYAAALIKPHDFIYMDAGTTTELMIDFITEKNAVFVTNAVAHAKKLSQLGCRTYILGGELKPQTEAIVGDEAVMSLEKYNFTKGFWGTNGVNLSTGFSTPDVREAMIKKKSMERCRERFVLCDESKFSTISSVTFADFSNAIIITNKLKDESLKKYRNIKEVDLL